MQQKFIKLVKFKKLSAEKSVTSILDLRALLGLQGVSEIKKFAIQFLFGIKVDLMSDLYWYIFARCSYFCIH